MKFSVAVLPGDGIGPDVITEALKVLRVVAKKSEHDIDFRFGLVGGIAIDQYGTALSEEALMMCKKSDAVLLGAVGHPKFDDPKAKVHPEDGLLALRKGLGLFANLRPVKVYPALVDNTNFKPEVVAGQTSYLSASLPAGFTLADPKSSGRRLAVGGLLTQCSTRSRRLSVLSGSALK